MQRSIRSGISLAVSVAAILGFIGVVHADDQTPESHHYRQEVRTRLNSLQSTLDSLFAAKQLTADQYQAESERVRQLKLQIHVDAKQDESMTKDERNTDFGLVRQISQEVSQMAPNSGILTNGTLRPGYPIPPAPPIPPVPAPPSMQ